MGPAPHQPHSSRLARLAALALLATLAACGGKSDKSDALSTLDSRLTNGVAEDNGPEAAGAETGKAAAGPTLGSLVRKQHAGATGTTGAKVNGACASDVRYGDQWAKAMPAALAVYPGGHLVEAAGVDNDRCALRIISFTTADAPVKVIDHYSARAREAGYDAEHLLCKGEHQLGGVRAADGAAYMLYARRTAKGRTEVDIVSGDGV